MSFDLAAIVRRTRNPRRSAIVIRDIAPPATLATDLFRSSYLPVVSRWEAAIDGLVAEYERTLSGLTRDSADDLTARLDAAASDIERLFILLDAGLRNWALRVENWQRGKWRGAILSATGVDLGTMIGPEGVRESLQSAINWNVSLVREVSAEARRRFGNAIFSGLNERRPARDVAKELREAAAMSRARSVRIASDQLSKLTSAPADERRREAGITVWKWRHSGKLHPRVRHQERDEQLYTDDPKMVGRVIDGKTVRAAPAPGDLPGRPPFCGCRSQSVLILDD